MNCQKFGLGIPRSDYSFYIYRTRAIITRGLYTFYPLFGVQKRFFKVQFWPYVWLVFKSGFYSKAGYSGARTVNQNTYDDWLSLHSQVLCINQLQINTIWRMYLDDTNIKWQSVVTTFCFYWKNNIDIIEKLPVKLVKYLPTYICSILLKLIQI